MKSDIRSDLSSDRSRSQTAPTVTLQRDYDADVYKWRHLVENYFAKIKEFRGIATRYDKTDCSYAANWNLAGDMRRSW